MWPVSHLSAPTTLLRRNTVPGPSPCTSATITLRLSRAPTTTSSRMTSSRHSAIGSSRPAAGQDENEIGGPVLCLTLPWASTPRSYASLPGGVQARRRCPGNRSSARASATLVHQPIIRPRFQSTFSCRSRLSIDCRRMRTPRGLSSRSVPHTPSDRANPVRRHPDWPGGVTCRNPNGTIRAWQLRFPRTELFDPAADETPSRRLRNGCTRKINHNGYSTVLALTKA